MPWSTDEQIKARAKLMVMQQRSATRAVASCSTVARELWWLINEQAARNVTVAGPCGELNELAVALVRLALVADTFQR